MKRSEYDRPRHPIGTSVPVQDTWRCTKCGVICGIRTGWKWVGTGKARRRICKPCYELRTMKG